MLVTGPRRQAPAELNMRHHVNHHDEYLPAPASVEPSQPRLISTGRPIHNRQSKPPSSETHDRPAFRMEAQLQLRCFRVVGGGPTARHDGDDVQCFFAA